MGPPVVESAAGFRACCWRAISERQRNIGFYLVILGVGRPILKYWLGPACVADLRDNLNSEFVLKLDSRAHYHALRAAMLRNGRSERAARVYVGSVRGVD